MRKLKDVDPEIYGLILKDLERQKTQLQLIASENYTSPAVLAAVGSVLTNKYAEGYPGCRYYQGCRYVSEVEHLAIERAKELFGAEHANVQPHSGTQANIAVYMAVLQPGDLILSMNLSHGGHLSHGLPDNYSGRLYQIAHYGVSRETEQIDFGEVARIAKETRPRLIIAGGSAYPRTIDSSRFAEIAREVGAMLMVDMAHFAGLVAGGVHPNPTRFADFVTATTHKTMRGARGGFVLCRSHHAPAVDSAVFPGLQGGPLMHVIAGKAVTFKEASLESFGGYQRQIVANARALAGVMAARGYRLVSGGTDTHLILVDLRDKGICGRDAANALQRAGITLNKNSIPFDPRPPGESSGIRIGTPAVTTRGMKENDMARIGDLIDRVLRAPLDETAHRRVRNEVAEFCQAFPIYQNLSV